jgi:hypothetical protein
MKKKYVQPSIANIEMENEIMNTYSGDHNSGTNNGQVGDAKSNNIFFDDEEEDDIDE